MAFDLRNIDKMELGQYELFARLLGDLREELGVHALQGIDKIGSYPVQMRSFMAMFALMGAAKKCAEASGMHKAFLVVCENFAKGTVAGEVVPGGMN